MEPLRDKPKFQEMIKELESISPIMEHTASTSDKIEKIHWPEGTYITQDYYPNIYWVTINNCIIKGYDNLALCEHYIESRLKEEKSNEFY